MTSSTNITLKLLRILQLIAVITKGHHLLSIKFKNKRKSLHIALIKILCCYLINTSYILDVIVKRAWVGTISENKLQDILSLQEIIHYAFYD